MASTMLLSTPTARRLDDPEVAHRAAHLIPFQCDECGKVECSERPDRAPSDTWRFYCQDIDERTIVDPESFCSPACDPYDPRGRR